ncbi:50S ribosomal protein L1 [Opitutales bacterium ASA1]|uniref:50S ribosomal protein L1 n=1 Tax=Congregicoccus parvus TaxID=3081749 RepID=UPI002B29421C|nr:50S ribosomal protein L1 [Opitutales bacterium ASA1]
MKKPSKKYRASLEVADLAKEYPLAEAVATLYRLPKAKFDETVDLSLRLAVDPRQGDQMVRGTVALPNGSGKKVRVLAFTENPDAARAAGAEVAGLKDVIAKIQEGWMDFDVAVATPEAMKEVRTIARVLGPKGLMPNPKSGTVSDNIAQAIKDVKAGRVEFKMDKAANVGVGIGKRSFTPEQIVENLGAALAAIGKARPASIKGKFIHSVVISTTMSPGVRLASSEYSKI